MWLFDSCNKKSLNEGKIIFTQVPSNSLNEKQLKVMDFRYASGMKIAVANFGVSLDNIRVLTGDFYSARAPEISYDAKSMVFSGQRNAGDIWQIWTMDLTNDRVFQITSSETNCTDPAWLPDGKIAYSKLMEDQASISYHALFKIEPDGCCEQRLTFQPHEDLNASVMKDGRILVASRQVYPDQNSVKYLALRPDGTKAELFYAPENTQSSLSKAVEDLNGRILFAESGMLGSIQFNRPLHSKSEPLNSNQGVFQSIYPMEKDRILASQRKPSESTFGISVLSLSNAESGSLYYNDTDFHMVEPVMIIQREIPRKLPSRVNMDMESGYLICMNTDDSEIDVGSDLGLTSRIQVLGMDEILGEAKVEEDGSFYLELTADKPVRFQTLNENGEVLRGPSSWMWVRPNERRGCVGCHENREIAPENKVPKAIEKAPFAMIK